VKNQTKRVSFSASNLADSMPKGRAVNTPLALNRTMPVWDDDAAALLRRYNDWLALRAWPLLDEHEFSALVFAAIA
jgi:hypothetical protein